MFGMTHHVVDQILQGSQTVFLYSTKNAEEPAQTAVLLWGVRWSERCSVVDYSVRGILQARILQWVAFPSSRGSSQPRDGTQVSRIAGGFFSSSATREGPGDV